MKYLALAIVVTSIGACTQQSTSKPQVTRMETNTNTEVDTTQTSFLVKNQGLLLDSATTTLGLAMGFAEANPLLSGACGTNPIAVGVCALGAKKVVEKSIDSVFGDSLSSPASKYTNSASYLAGCANLALITGIAFPVNLAIGGICAKAYWDVESRKTAAPKRTGISSAELIEATN